MKKLRAVLAGETAGGGEGAGRWWVLGAVCLAAFAINLDTTIVNVALPSLSRQLGAGTRALQWVVDAYNLTFAALVLAAGSLGDRSGRRPALLVGLLGFGLASGVGALSPGVGELIAARAVMGAFAALIFPTTLSVLTNAFPDRGERARAVGVWGAVTGLGVAVGPVTGGLLLASFSWPSVFVALVPLALLAAVAVVRYVPESRDPAAPRLDRLGLVGASGAMATLVYTIIQAPARGWGSLPTLAGFTIAVILGVAFVMVERRQIHPMLDVSLFRERAFSAASGAVTVAFFGLFGFIFMITQYMQFVRGYGTLSTGLRILPVAISIGASSVVGARLVGRAGTRAIVTTGLLMLGGAFLWISQASAGTPYRMIVFQMLMMGTGLGLTTAPATESILSVLPAAHAGVGSAVNDATREAGGTLGVAVIGSVFTSLYASGLRSGRMALPHGLLHAAQGSVGEGYALAGRLHGATGAGVGHLVQHSFMSGLHAGCLVAAAVCWTGMLGARYLPGRRVPLASAAVGLT
jgi:EmrB/QacA subfamily drug resistance transporter